jgi:hypothetical protein
MGLPRIFHLVSLQGFGFCLKNDFDLYPVYPVHPCKIKRFLLYVPACPWLDEVVERK